jgi:hypothetical protein
LLACTVAFSATAAAGWWTTAAHERTLTELAPALVAARSNAQPVAEARPDADFTAALPPQAAATRFVAALTQAAQNAGVAMESVAVSEQAPTAGALGRQSFTLSLRGSYPAIKRVLGEVLPTSAGVSRLRMQYDDVSATVQTEMQVSLWSAAAPAPAAVER